MSIFKDYSEMEFLLSNGLGGTSSSTGICLNSRRYHSILSVSLNPPVNRRILVSRCTERVNVNGKTYMLSNLKTVNGFVENGYENIISFETYPIPKWIYKTGNTLIEKKIIMINQRNVTVLYYKNLFGEDIELEIVPYFNDRDIHNNSLPGDVHLREEKFDYNYAEYSTNFLNNISVKTNGDIDQYEHTLHNVFYDIENQRGLFAYEELLSKINIRKKLKAGESLYIIFGGNELIFDIEPDEELKNEIQRISSLASFTNIQVIKQLTVTADSFIVRRNSTGKLTIIAGYPWFTDWGRDTMIAIDGLLIETGRYSDAREVLETFLMNTQNGLIPNVFDDYNGNPGGYNTVDGTLWMFYALYKYYLKTNDKDFIEENYKILVDILNHHIKGTEYGIKMDESDYLLNAGNNETQLTWMDVKVGNWAVTPRYGKAVEINALWYNAFKIMEFFSAELSKNFTFKNYPEKIKHSFNNVFWYEKGGYLYDVVNPDSRDNSVRPNQIFAIGLPFELLNRNQEIRIVNKVFDELYTPFGLRTLSKNDPRYIGIYTGDRWTRDGAYHQGNVWPWLTGQFLESFLKINNYSDESKDVVKGLLQPVEDMINTLWSGTIPEIVEGNWPHEKRGCFSQAWSVSEFLRIFILVNKK